MNQNLFNSIPLKRPNKNVFDLSHDVKLSLDMGQLVPVLAMECVPGDSFSLACDSLLRFQPLIAPVMHRMHVSFHYFFVPNRLLWDNWETFITGGQDPVVHTPEPNFPTITYSNDSYNKLIDYMGLPSSSDPARETEVSALPFAAYLKIYDDYYRDQNLIVEQFVPLVDGDNNANFAELTTLRKRAWTHDYFTSALPWAQKGNPVNLPAGNLPDIAIARNTSGTGATFEIEGVNQPGSVPGDAFVYNAEAPLINDDALYLPSQPIAATTINDLRRAFRLQEWLEKNARAGTRYTESILAHFGVKSSDARLQRAEYITGSRSPVQISEVLNTTGENGGLPQGNMAGHGISVTTGYKGNYFCEEHGYIMCIMSVIPEPAYQQGIPKHFLKRDKFDFFWPEFAHIGEQEVLLKELYNDDGDGDQVFGYVPRSSEYKYMPSRVAGDLKTSLVYWTLSRIFESEPALNQQFVECTPDKRIFAVIDPDQNSLISHVYHKIRAVRPMPKFGVPSF